MEALFETDGAHSAVAAPASDAEMSGDEVSDECEGEGEESEEDAEEADDKPVAGKGGGKAGGPPGAKRRRIQCECCLEFSEDSMS